MGEAGVGGGGFGGVSSEFVVEIGSRASWGESALFFNVLTCSVSVSEPLWASSSRSQLSATGLDFGFCAVFCGCEVESWRLPRVSAISVHKGLLLGEVLHAWGG